MDLPTRDFEGVVCLRRFREACKHKELHAFGSTSHVEKKGYRLHSGPCGLRSNYMSGPAASGIVDPHRGGGVYLVAQIISKGLIRPFPLSGMQIMLESALILLTSAPSAITNCSPIVAVNGAE